MITFNLILQSAGVNSKKLRLVRHQDTRREARGSSPYGLWRRGDGSYDFYQRIQARHVFNVGDTLASFVVTPGKETLFTGLYLVEGESECPSGTIDPLTGETMPPSSLLYDISRDPRMMDLEGLIVIDWGAGARAWVQLAENQDKRVIELRRTFTEPRFPGFSEFMTTFDRLGEVPYSWIEVLRAVSGIYLITDTKTGKHYVGSAYGTDGLWGRFVTYFETGHGDNVELKKLANSPSLMQLSILEVLPPSLTPDQVFAIEGRWKDKLRSREFGLNAN
jgi:hypothetical protein